MERFDLEKYSGQKVIAVTKNERIPYGSKFDVEILKTDIKSSWPILAVVKYTDSYEEVYQFDKIGLCQDVNSKNERLFDLYFAPTKRTRWVNVYKLGELYTSGGFTYVNEREAKDNIIEDGCEKYITTVPIEFED